MGTFNGFNFTPVKMIDPNADDRFTQLQTQSQILADIIKEQSEKISKLETSLNNRQTATVSVIQSNPDDYRTDDSVASNNEVVILDIDNHVLASSGKVIGHGSGEIPYNDSATVNTDLWAARASETDHATNADNSSTCDGLTPAQIESAAAALSVNLPKIIGTEQTLVNVSNVLNDTTYNIALETTDKASIGDTSTYARSYLLYISMTAAYSSGATSNPGSVVFNFISGATGAAADPDIANLSVVNPTSYNKTIALLVPHGRYQMMVHVVNTAGIVKFSLLIKAKEIKFSNIIYSSL